MNERSDYATWMLFFAAGSLAGAGAALLFAPQSGRDTRGRMGRRLRRAGRSARDLAERTVRRGEELGSEATRRVEEAAAVIAGNGGERSTAGPSPSR